jgi:hypothetical protein
VKFVVDANCLISVLVPATGKTLALKDPEDHEIWLSRLRKQLVRAFSSGILIATEALKEELAGRAGTRGRGKEATEIFIAELKTNGVRFHQIEPRDQEIITQLDELVRKDFDDYQADSFLRGNDIKYVAVALRMQALLATLESQAVPEFDPRSAKIKGKPKIPYVAWRLGVQTVGLYYVLQHLVETCGPSGERENHDAHGRI